MRQFYLLFVCLFSGTMLAQWEPGSEYREYLLVTPEEGEAFFRVGGKYGYADNPGKLPTSVQVGDELIIPGRVDLQGAVRAELCLEKVMSHEDSRNLRVAVNGYLPRLVPEPEDIPEPQTEYMYHTEVRVDIPLEELFEGKETRLKLTLDSTQRWNWPQNLLYGITLRIYYASPTNPAPAAPPLEIKTAGRDLGEIAYFTINTPVNTQHVDYIFVGRDADWGGRGSYQRKHWQSHRGQPLRTLGRSIGPDFGLRWSTSWLPDQPSFGVQARALGADGKYRVSAVLDGLKLAPRPYTVDFYAPGPAPRNWVTRSGEFKQEIEVSGGVEDVTALRLHWVSWSPCYSNGLFLNGHLIWSRTPDCYVFATQDPVYAGYELEALQSGTNVFHTALTPLFRGKMVHGMEVQWPGIQLKVRREKGQD